MSAFAPLRGRIRGAERVAFVTGAGISTESGIPTYRGRGGLWRDRDVMRLATAGALEEDPGLAWEWYAERRAGALAARPNPGHEAVAGLEAHARVSVLTQNVDGLHQRAGSTEVLELHGSLARTRCTSCGLVRDGGELPGMPPECGCGAMLRPDVVWFGEELPRDTWRRAAGIASECDLMVVAGTSLEVSPANTLPLLARRGGAALVEVNTDATPMTPAMDLSARGACSELLPELAREFARATRAGRPARR